MKRESKTLIFWIVIIILVTFILTGITIYFMTKPKYYLKEEIPNSHIVNSETINISYKMGNEIILENMSLENIYESINYIEFKISGSNTLNKDCLCKVYLAYGINSKTKNLRIKDKFLNFKLVEIKNNQEEILFVDTSYQNIENSIILNEIVKSNASINKTYRLYMYVSDNIKIGDESNSDYSVSLWKNNVFASITIGTSYGINN